MIDARFSSRVEPRSTDVLQHLLQTVARDRRTGRVQLADRLADRPHGAGAARRARPAAPAEGRLHRFELEARGHAGPLEALLGDLAVAEESLAQRHAAHLQAFELERREPIADDQLGAAAADVDDQPPARLARHGMRDARVDEARLFHARNDFDGMPERLARPFEEGLLAAGDPQGVGAHDAHAARMHGAQALPESLQAGERARGRFLVDAAVLFDARSQAHHLAQPVDDDELAVRIPRHDHVKAIGAEIDRSQHIRHGACGGAEAGFGGERTVGAGLTRDASASGGERRAAAARRTWRSGCG